MISDSRFHRLAERAIAVHQLGTTSIDRLLERVERGDLETLRAVRSVVRQITD